MANCDGNTITALIVAVEETAGSALYGMIDVLASAGNLWQELVGIDATHWPLTECPDAVRRAIEDWVTRLDPPLAHC